MAPKQASNNTSAILQSQAHDELLDAIDELRSHGASHYVDLPQIIVCGDQSSGKSSVLEAVSAVRFPKDDNLCTRFATELVLRRGAQETISVSIQPGEDRTEDEAKRLSSFSAPEAQLSQLASLIETAKVAMGIGVQDNGDQGKTFSNDVLKVELTGPKQPHLTLVDLPGLIRTETKGQRAGDVLLVETLVKRYMKNPRSIILAVVSAKNDFANQVITKLASDLDPEGLRTMGILTKPDVLEAGSPSEQFYVRVTQNEEKHFRLGWHALRNRTWGEQETTDDERDHQEQQFFRKGLWATIPSSHLGIATLKPRLTQVLQDQIRAQMPSLIEEVRAGIQDCKARLDKLGISRTKFSDQRKYLIRISQSFQMLVKAGVEGTYNDNFFGGIATKEDVSKRLRAVVQNQLMDFARQMRRKGHARRILSDVNPTDGSDMVAEEESGDEQEKDFDPTTISRSDYVDEVKEMMKKTRGCELPGTFNPLIIGSLFFAQSKPWRELVDEHAANISDSTREFLDHVLRSTTPDENTRLRIRQIVIGPAIDQYEKELAEKVDEILRPHQTGHPITYNHYFTETIQKVSRQRTNNNLKDGIKQQLRLSSTQISSGEDYNLNFNPASLVASLGSTTEKDMESYSSSTAIDCMQAYYKVALKTFIDNFASLAVEHCLLEKLTKLFTPETVDDFSDEMISSIAAETEESQAERASAEKKQASLEHSLRILRNFSRYGASMTAQTNNLTADMDKRGPQFAGQETTSATSSPPITINTPSPGTEVERNENEDDMLTLDLQTDESEMDLDSSIAPHNARLSSSQEDNDGFFAGYATTSRASKRGGRGKLRR